jgi:hypothetical protein
MADSYPAINGTGLVTTGAAQTISGAKTFLAGSATTVPVTVKAFAGQTSNLTEWQDSSGAVQASINSNGRIKTPVLLVGTADVQTLIGNGQLRLITENAAERGIVVRGFASQSANLQEWQDSAGTILSRVDPSGIIWAARAVVQGGSTASVPLQVRGQLGQTADLASFQNSAGTVGSYVRANGSIVASAVDGTTTALYAIPGSASAKGLVVQGFASQTANLQEWQNSAGTVLKGVYSSGATFITPTATASTSLFLRTGQASAIGMEVRASASQTANLIDVQNSSGSTLWGVNFDGSPIYSGGVSGGTAVGTYWGRIGVYIIGVGTKYMQIYN